MDRPKVSFFFGAGAEISYGLPSGQRFALEVFRRDQGSTKRSFREQLERVDERSRYARRWLPRDFKSKRLHSYGKQQREGLLASSFECRRYSILSFLKTFDKQSDRLAKDFEQKGSDLKGAFQEVTGVPFGSQVLGGVIRLNKAFEQQSELFDSGFFSGLLQVLEKTAGTRSEERNEVKACVRTFVELLIGAAGEEIIRNLNDNIVEETPDTLDVFDDLAGLFRIEYKSLGMEGLNHILDDSPPPLASNSTAMQVIAAFAFRILEEIYCIALDYQSLLDDNFRYIYSPKNDWAKFSKICLFLISVRDYILEGVPGSEVTDGFYHDTQQLRSRCEIVGVGTSNYNTLVSSVIPGVDVFHLNGSTEDFYDPYKNKRVSEAEAVQGGHICVPFLFTQSGIKPMTSISMSSRYVDLFNRFRESDLIVVIGFGFNSDDGHINGLFRELIEDRKKKVLVLWYGQESNDVIYERLRIEDSASLIVRPIDDKRQSNGKPWTEVVLEEARGT